MIRVVLPAHLRTLTQAGGEVELEVAGQVTQRSVLDALEARYPVLRGTIRGHDGGPRRAFVRFFACEQDLSHEQPDAPLPEAVGTGAEPYLIVGAMAGGWIRRPLVRIPAATRKMAGTRRPVILCPGAARGGLRACWVTAVWRGPRPGRPSGPLPTGCPAAGCRTGRGR